MILRRVIDHFRKQEWTAIFLDFVIVVVGVFVGLQVNNWNEARRDRARAAIYSERLTSELQAEFEYTTSLIDYNVFVLDAGNLAYKGLAGKTALEDETVLINAFRASQYNWYERRRAAFDEIVGSGSLALITDASLRETAIGIYNTPIFSITQAEGQNARYRDLFRMAIEPSLHDDLSRNCGDKEIDDGGVAVGLVTLDYACTLAASPEEIAAGVSALRGDPEILRALKLRNAQVSGRTYDLNATLRTYGMNKRFRKESAP
jgi:hypothetical protein